MNRKVIGFTPHPKQKEVIDSIIKGPAKFHIATIGRQWGKSLMGMNLALYWMINHKPCKVLWISPVFSQANKVHKEMYSAIKETGIIKSNNYGDNSMTLHNGSSITFRSAERFDNIRGLTMQYGICDEASFMKDDAWREAIRPVFATAGPESRVCFLSTPKGKNWFYDLYQIGRDPDNPRYKSYTGSSYETPYIDDVEIADAKKTLPEQVFRQEYEAQFIDGGGEVFHNIDSITQPVYPQPIGKVYCGIDLAKQEDWTCAVFQDSQGRVVDIYRDRHTTWGSITKNLVERIKKWNALVVVEVNSIGDVIAEKIQDQWQDTHPFVTTNKSKNEVIEGLILDVSEGNLTIPSKELFPALHHEMTIFTFDYNPKSRTLRYSHPPGSHDDTVIALALSNYARKKYQSRGTYAVLGRGR